MHMIFKTKSIYIYIYIKGVKKETKQVNHVFPLSAHVSGDEQGAALPSLLRAHGGSLELSRDNMCPSGGRFRFLCVFSSFCSKMRTVFVFHESAFFGTFLI
uniref:Uncharacterized protein n=1 Tax=Trypanosoma congolense (strain IL3000) TaxID=1068625 RepID=G0UU72_TRYCI|nr:hypothetical protein, unlikely [Trypanosoma congolense IL3000]